MGRLVVVGKFGEAGWPTFSPASPSDRVQCGEPPRHPLNSPALPPTGAQRLAITWSRVSDRPASLDEQRNGVTMNYHDLVREVIEDLVPMAEEEIRAFRIDGRSEIKDRQDLVTEVDLTIEAHLADLLPRLLPGSAFRGEESGSNSTNARTVGEWIVDPIDGTINFARRIPMYTSAFCLRVAGETELAVVLAFTERRGVYAVKDNGTHCFEFDEAGHLLNLRPASVCDRPLEQTLTSVMLTPRLSDFARRASTELCLLLLDNSQGLRIFVSQAYEGLLTATGDLDYMILFHSTGGWTRDAIRLLCEEAGGYFSFLSPVDPERSERGYMLCASQSSADRLAPTLRRAGYAQSSQ
jgi:fructose-1,6-bisphosphatase/inositol monophosphatase family enzyme